ncbi:MAG: CoA transferase, partial [Pseudonocardia sp.]|nr:CoA transferase [Pseudonocardia sp.]
MTSSAGTDDTPHTERSATGSSIVSAPLAGVRVLEMSTGRAARTAGMLLADLGADVVRVPGAGAPTWDPDDPGTPEHLVVDRGKRLLAGPADLPRLAARAEVVLDDSPSGAAPLPGPVHVAMPPYGTDGPDLPPDPLLLAALGGFAGHHPAAEQDRPVASVVPLVEAVHGALGAVAAAAGVLGFRTTGHGRRMVVSGLHASAACLSTMMLEGLDVDRVFSPGVRLPGSPNFRAYRCADGLFLHLAALTADFFLRALEVLDRFEVMVAPGVEGEFTNLLVPEIGRPVGEELARTFATRDRDDWLVDLAAAGVPAAPVRTHAEWLEGEIVAAAAPPVVAAHPVVGTVTMPGVPVRLPENPGEIRYPGGPDHTVTKDEVWPGVVPADPAGPTADRPLEGLRVVDLSTFLAAPFASTLLADLGAEVVKVETMGGDPYRVFSASYAAVNQAKTVGGLDLASPPGRAALLRLAGEADVLVDNLRPASMARLGLDDAVLTTAGPRLVRCSVSAFGRSGPFAELPGFDPVLQALSGLSAAQGGAGDPVATTAPVVDVATGALAGLGALAALVARDRTGRGQHVTASLAATSTFLQLEELTTYGGRGAPGAGGGRPPPPRG